MAGTPEQDICALDLCPPVEAFHIPAAKHSQLQAEALEFIPTTFT